MEKFKSPLEERLEDVTLKISRIEHGREEIKNLFSAISQAAQGEILVRFCEKYPEDAMTKVIMDKINLLTSHIKGDYIPPELPERARESRSLYLQNFLKGEMTSLYEKFVQYINMKYGEGFLESLSDHRPDDPNVTLA
ncbi:MAG: hypothetical protein WC531_03155 [Candidatus Paceibacterota bacterium]|jgi:hypothetical protein